MTSKAFLTFKDQKGLPQTRRLPDASSRSLMHSFFEFLNLIGFKESRNSILNMLYQISSSISIHFIFLFNSFKTLIVSEIPIQSVRTQNYIDSCKLGTCATLWTVDIDYFKLGELETLTPTFSDLIMKLSSCLRIVKSQHG